ncbi:MAG: V-type ATP synthase subunit E, partial [Spirochaetaceae bacterium]
MDVQLKELIERIKSEGIENAENEADRIIKESQEAAKKIVGEAESEADKIRKKAEEDAAKREETGRASLKQAGRDVILSVEKRLQEIFDRIIYQETSQVLKGNILEEAVMQVVKNWDSDVTDLKVLIAEDELKKIEESLRKKLSTKLTEGVEIKPLPKTEAGFQISMKDGSAYYNFTAEGIAELLSQVLNPRLAEILKEAAEE